MRAVLDGIVRDELKLGRVAQRHARAQLAPEIARRALEPAQNVLFERFLQNAHINARIAQVARRIHMGDGHHAALDARVLERADERAELALDLFIDASNDFEAGKNQNILRECDIDKIVETYEHRVDVDKYAHVATMQEIEENGFNLNIPRYVDTFEPEEEIDLNAVAAEIRNIQAEIKGIDAQLKPFFDELGLDFPFDVEGK